MTTIPLTGLAPLFLGGRPDDPALIVGSFVMTYDELTTAVLAEAARLGPRRLHVHPMRNDVDSVVRLLAALAAGHPVVLVGADEGARHDEISAAYEGATDLHPDLARAALDVRIHGLAEARQALAGQPRGQRGEHRGVPHARAGGPGDHVPAAPLLLRAVGAHQPPGERCVDRAH